jgi:phosphopantothenoylcysteine synthetase/decarboxylase
MIAEQALEAGAQVTFVYGKGSLTPGAHPALSLVEIATVADLLEAVERELAATRHDAIVHSMAVLDYEPAAFVPDKTPSGRDEWVIRLRPTPKVIARMKTWAPDALLVGFKLEDMATDDELIAEARHLAERTGATFVVANNLGEIEQGQHRALFVAADGSPLAEVTGKEAIATTLIDLLSQRLADER